MHIVSRSTVPAWMRRLGLGGFVFFMAKGLLWLTVPYLAGALLN